MPSHRSTPALTIVGGVYDEFCHDPDWRQIYGSGGRAAIALARLAPRTSLHTYLPKNWKANVEQLMRGYRVDLQATLTDKGYYFSYVSGALPPLIEVPPVQELSPLQVKAERVLQFGMLEGQAKVEAEYAVYDAQAGPDAAPFAAGGSKAKHLALVLNASEAAALSGTSNVAKGAKRLLKAGAEAVVVKAGPAGAYVEDKKTAAWIPAYVSTFVWPIGSGDVFSAVFFFFWAGRRYPAKKAAALASKATALYCHSMSAPVDKNIEILRLPKGVRQAKKSGTETKHRPLVYLAGPFFSLAEITFVEQVRQALTGLGLDVFSPLHDVGLGEAHEVAPADIAGLKRSDIVFALTDGVDSGTMFEAGYARALGKPVVAYGRSIPKERLTMLAGSDCQIESDLATALYRTAWIAYGQ